MAAITASEAISPAYQRTKQMLFEPFHLDRWLKLGLVMVLAGQVVSFNFNVPGRRAFPVGTGSGDIPSWHMPRGLEAIGLFTIIVVAIAVVAVFTLIGLYLWSRFRFILMDSVLEANCQIGRYWERNSDAGNRLFGWMLVISFAMLALALVFIGGPLLALLRALHSGIHPSGAQLATLLASAATMGLLVLVYELVLTFVRDFVVPVMAFEQLSFPDACGRVWELASREAGPFAIYILLKIVLSIAIGIMAFFVMLFAFIPVAIVGVILVILGVILAKAAGGAAVLVLIFAGVLVGVPAFLYLMGIISAPFGVFMQAYALYFFSGRYAPLTRVLMPQPVIPVVPADSVQPPPQNEPPPLLA